MKLLIAAISLALAACASNIALTSDEFDSGVRRGRVEGLVDESTSIVNTRLDCRSGPGQYAVVSYSYGGSPNLRANVIVPAKSLKRGDETKVNIRGCQ